MGLVYAVYWILLHGGAATCGNNNTRTTGIRIFWTSHVETWSGTVILSHAHKDQILGPKSAPDASACMHKVTSSFVLLDSWSVSIKSLLKKYTRHFDAWLGCSCSHWLLLINAMASPNLLNLLGCSQEDALLQAKLNESTEKRVVQAPRQVYFHQEDETRKLHGYKYK